MATHCEQRGGAAIIICKHGVCTCSGARALSP
jgi:hypothetical protein